MLKPTFGEQPDGSWKLDGDALPVYSPVCTYCSWMGSTEFRTCMAYPGGIPVVIWTGLHNHSTPYPGDEGYRFTPAPAAVAAEETPLAKSMATATPFNPTAHPHAPAGGQGRYAGGEFIPRPGESADELLGRWEREIITHPHETACWVLADGNTGRRSGGTNEVVFSVVERNSFGGARMTHNHPVSGGSFSNSDVCFAVCNGLAEMRAVGKSPDHPPMLYRMVPPPGGWNREWWERTGLPAYYEAVFDVTQRLADDVQTGRMSAEAANALHWHAVWQEWAKNTKAVYAWESMRLGKALSCATLFPILSSYADPDARAGNEVLFPALRKACEVHGVNEPDWLSGRPQAVALLPNVGSARSEMEQARDTFVEERILKAMPGKVPKTAPKTMDWEHPMTGMDEKVHTSHMRHHEAEFRALQHQLAACDPDDGEERRKIVQAMRQCATHWNQHRQGKYLQSTGGKKLPKLMLKARPDAKMEKAFNPSEARDKSGEWTAQAVQGKRKEVAAAIRSALKTAGIKARVSGYSSGGSSFARVDVPVYGQEFTDEQQVAIRTIAVDLGLSWVRGLRINIHQNTNPESFHFEIGARRMGKAWHPKIRLRKERR